VEKRSSLPFPFSLFFLLLPFFLSNLFQSSPSLLFFPPSIVLLSPSHLFTFLLVIDSLFLFFVPYLKSGLASEGELQAPQAGSGAGHFSASLIQK